MKFDLHNHHDRCGHAIGTLTDYIESAIALGLDVIGISDHAPFFYSDVDHLYPPIAMAKSEFPRYVAEVLALKEQYAGRIEVLLGVESDFFPEHAELYKQVYAQYPFDYVIGSVHTTGGTHIFDRRRWEGQTPEQLAEQVQAYYELVRLSARSGLFQIIGHIDALKRTNPAVSDIPVAELDRVLQAIAYSGAAMEINTSGKRMECASWYPSDDILERACRYGVDVTFASDAHSPERLADDFELVRKRLTEIGYRDWVFFRNRHKIRVTL